jgi:hypothetical protein
MARKCTTHERLENAYKLLQHRCNLYRFSSATERQSSLISPQLKRDIIKARVAAANELYLHSIECPLCKSERRAIEQ